MGLLGLLFKTILGIGLSNKPSVKSKNRAAYNSAVRYATVEVEGRSRLKVINESLSIIDKTKNLITLNGRYDTICEHMKWMMDNNIKLNNESAYIAQQKVDDNKNENIVRIACDAFDSYEKKFRISKTEKVKDNATIKIFKLIDDCISSIVDSENKVLKRKILIVLRNRVEDIYS